MSKQYNSVKEMIEDLYKTSQHHPNPQKRKEAKSKINQLWNITIIRQFGWTGKIAVKNWRKKGMKHWQELLKPEKVVFT